MSAKRAKNLNYLRASNSGSVVRHLLLWGTASRQQLAESLGLTKMSLTYIAGDLLSKGLIEEEIAPGGTSPGTNPGRKPALLRLKPARVLAIGVYVSRTQVASTLCNLSGQVLCSRTHKVTPRATRQSLTEVICRQVQTLLNECAHPERVCGIGFSTIGLVDSGTGVVVSTTDFFGIANWPVKQLLEERFSLPVFMANDVKAACLAELYYGSGKPYTDFIYLGLTHGLGGGVLMNGRLLEGANGFSGELGHTALYAGGKKCACGNTGCAELYLSVPVLLKKAGVPDWRAFVRLAQADHPEPVMEDFLADMGIFLTSLINTFDPQAIIIGHEGAQLGSCCFEKLQLSVSQSAMTRRVKQVDILPSALKGRITHLGPISIVFSQLFRGSLSL